MTPNSMPLDALLGHVSNSDQDRLREILGHTLQALIEAEAAGAVGTQPTSAARVGSVTATGSGNGPWSPAWRRLGIPNLRQGSFLPSFLAPRRRIERALWAVIQEAWVHGGLNRRVDDLVAAMGSCHVSKNVMKRAPWREPCGFSHRNQPTKEAPGYGACRSRSVSNPP